MEIVVKLGKGDFGETEKGEKEILVELRKGKRLA
jgi:hypothetical protein